MTREQIQKEIEEMDAWIPVREIEKRLGMPPTTLQKVLSGKRELPKKWFRVLKDYFIKPTTPPNDQNESATPTEEDIQPESETEAPPVNRTKVQQLIYDQQQLILKNKKQLK